MSSEPTDGSTTNASGAGSFQDHFAPQAGQYAAFRPSYPAAMIAAIAAHAPRRDCCWDVGTGSGQAAVMLAEHFTRVEATDASASQIAHAMPNPRVRYRVAPAERVPFDDASVDAVTIAQALHWFNLGEFYAEVRRVASPGAIIAAWSYGNIEVDAAVDAVVRWFYEERVGSYWPPERRHVEDRYTSLAFPFPRVELPAPSIEAMLDREALTGYISTWSALKRAREREGGDPLDEFRERLARVWPDASSSRRVCWPMIVLAGRVSDPR
jgi:SAM-dependent methyltransferase